MGAVQQAERTAQVLPTSYAQWTLVWTNELVHSTGG